MTGPVRKDKKGEGHHPNICNRPGLNQNTGQTGTRQREGENLIGEQKKI